MGRDGGRGAKDRFRFILTSTFCRGNIKTCQLQNFSAVSMEDSQQVVCSIADESPAVHYGRPGVGGHDSAFERQHLQQFRYRFRSDHVWTVLR
jgi:hypothetical protein